MLSAKQASIKYNFWVFGMTQPGIEPRSPELVANTNHYANDGIFLAFVLIVNLVN